MAEHNELGKAGEVFAANYLEENGYQVLVKNYTFQKAEIDIIAQKGDILAVIEVKTRSSLDFGLPQDFVKPKKIQLLVKAINHFIEKENLDVKVRFDIIAISNINNQFSLEHLEDAFYYF